MKKAISILLSFVMLLSITAGLGLSAYADDQRTVSLNAGNGSVTPATITLDEAGKLPELPTPTRAGWNFVGWYTAEVEENYWGDAEDENVNDRGAALRARYEEYFSGLSDDDWKEMLYSWIIVSAGREVKAGEALEEGVNTLYAKYEPTTVTVNWHLNGWHKEDGIALTATPQYDSPITALDLMETQYKCETDDDYKGHTFEGWFTAAEGGTEWTFDGANGCSSQRLNGDLDLYAHWSGGKETDSIKINTKASHVHPGETFSITVSYSGVQDKEVNKPVITWECDEYVELVSTDDLTFIFKVSEDIDVSQSNKALTLTAKTENGDLTDSVDITAYHSWDNGITQKETCIETVVKYTCTYDGCGAEKLVSVPNYGEHTVVTDEAVEATCTTEGKTAGSHCSVCGEIIVAQETVEKLAHTFGDVKEENGVKTRICSVCGYTEIVTSETEAPTPEAPSQGETAVSATSATYAIGSENGASIQLSAPIDDLTNVYVNGNKVDKANYTLSEDGTVITFTSEYLDTLEAGEYEVTLETASGSVSTKLTVEKADDEAAAENPTDPAAQDKADDEAAAQDPTGQTNPTEQTKQPAQEKADKNGASSSPSTGAQKGGLVLMAIALAGGVAMIIKKKERE